jgi:hypothetical protein
MSDQSWLGENRHVPSITTNSTGPIIPTDNPAKAPESTRCEMCGDSGKIPILDPATQKVTGDLDCPFCVARPAVPAQEAPQEPKCPTCANDLHLDGTTWKCTACLFTMPGRFA